MTLDQSYWTNRYLQGDTGWDLGEISPPIKDYIDQIKDKNLRILVPGCGHGYEGLYLWDMGFKNTHFLDFSPAPLKRISESRSEIPSQQLIQHDFFSFNEKFDLILEQTLFCAISPNDRPKYAKHTSELLSPGGKLVGVFFNKDFEGGPPFGGSKEEYLQYFEPYFSNISMEECHNSITPRSGCELFAIMRK